MPQPRKSNRLKALTGVSVRVPPISPAMEDDQPPSWLPLEAQAEWTRVMDHITRSHFGHLQELDRPGLSAYCMVWSTWLVAAQDVAKRGPLVPGRSSADAARSQDEEVLVKNPAVQIMRDAGIQLQRWCREFGFTPDSRNRMDVPGPPEGSDLLSPGRFLS